MKFRLIKEVYEELRKEDPDTEITLYGLTRLVKSGRIPSISIGKKTLIRYEDVKKYLDVDFIKDSVKPDELKETTKHHYSCDSSASKMNDKLAQTVRKIR